MSPTILALLLAPAPTPLLDGQCNEYRALGATQWPLAEHVTLFAWQDTHHVWLCASLPEGSLGVADIALETAALEAPVNLHASAQLGEWNPADEGSIPTTPDSDKWWNNRGWAANTIRINGTHEVNGQRRPKLLNDVGREFQIGKQRFGKGRWVFSVNLNGLPSESGEQSTSVESAGLMYEVD